MCIRDSAFADQPGDPHSPVIFGLKKVVLEGYELYTAATRDPYILEHYGRGTPDDWLERKLYSRWPAAGIVLFILLELALFGVPGIVMVAVHMAAQPFFAGGVINGVGHRLGYRSFEMPSTATNILPWGDVYKRQPPGRPSSARRSPGCADPPADRQRRGGVDGLPPTRE